VRKNYISKFALVLTIAILTSFISLPGSSAANGYLYSTTPSPYVEGDDEAANIFDPVDVNSIQLDVDESIIEYFRSCCDWQYEGPWREAQLTMTVKGETVGPLLVGFHLKGAWGSWRTIDTKPGIKIKVDAFVEGQKIFGVKKMILNNMAQEGSALNQQLAMRVFRAMGVPASRTGYTNLHINDLNYGLYTMIESLDRVSLSRWFDSTQHLYKGGVPYHWADLVPEYEYVFQVETGSLTNRNDLMPLLQANAAEDWWTEINKVADMQEMVREWAVEQTIGHWDGYSYNGNNYFIHSDENGIFTMLPWGVDGTWGGPIDYNWTSKIMSQRCIQTPQCFALYVQAVADATYAIKTLDLDQMVVDISQRINPELADNVEPYWRRYWFNSNSLGDIQWYQTYVTRPVLDGNYDWALNNYQDVPGVSRVQLYDSALSQLRVAGKKIEIPVAENDLSTVYLQPGTKSVTVSATTRQSQADVEISALNNLKTGLNTISVDVTSRNGQSSQTYEISAYVLTKASTNLVVSTTGTKNRLTERSFVKLHNTGVVTGIKAIKDLKVTVTGSMKNGTTMLKKIMDVLKDAGMSTPDESTYKTNSRMAKDTTKVVITYLK
jgi:hypothetical protein